MNPRASRCSWTKSSLTVACLVDRWKRRGLPGPRMTHAAQAHLFHGLLSRPRPSWQSCSAPGVLAESNGIPHGPGLPVPSRSDVRFGHPANPVRHGGCRAGESASCVGRGCPCPLGGRSPRPSGPSLTRRRLRSDIHVSAGRLRRSRARATPPEESVEESSTAQQRTPLADKAVAASVRITSVI